ncbi:divergent polysaccharide deacetylase family protein [Shimia marina]|uniref:Divergent polysaccharide deacetylase n=1 Tax=Shimia marina TaxID=321267 RepID=A0A0P1ESK8_9RHOB|nr:divergent polysaccharide deacetylase family protein [Shimia marina]CUH53543.1 Divergent polysaccharide deacetylase [Shimia marina]SFD74679.1 Uncharacterized conserved protein YibQ, putative polysaccharide deacetylase 2 family [Shimia marina]
MLRGVLAGAFWGVILVGGVLSAVSLLLPLPATVTPQTSAEAPKDRSQVAPVSGALQDTSEADTTVEAAPAADAPSQAGGDQPPLSDTESAPKPETGGVEAALAAPVAPQGGGAVAVEAESPVLPNPQAQNPEAPDVETELSISTNPAQPSAPEVAASEAFVTPEAAPEVPAQAEDAPLETATEGSADDSGADGGDALVSEAVPSPEAEDVTPRAEAEEAPAPAETAETMIKPAGDLNEAFPQHKSTRLPTVGVAAENAEAPAPRASRPVEANAEAFENPDQKPLMAIVLVDAGAQEFDMEALTSFPYPVSIAVSTLDPQVGQKVETYRSQGLEVLAMIDLPAEAEAADVEQAMQAHLSVSDQFVGVVEGLEEGLQSSKVISDQVTEALMGSGHGLLMFTNGLNTAQKLAAKEGVPSASVFRDFDDKGQTSAVMRRFLDQAAFKAAQEDGVVMVGRLRDETLSALLLWALQDRINTVALGPVSALFDTIN